MVVTLFPMEDTSMPEPTYVVDRLVVFLSGHRRERGPERDLDRVVVDLRFKNPVGSPGSTRRPPNMEVWDNTGRVYPVVNADWAEPVLPDTELQAPATFEVATDAEELDLVLAPGEPDETHVPLTSG
jgi:hypothetical protein